MAINANKTSEGFDPITLEVLNMRLQNIVEEMGIALRRSSGSAVIAENADMNTAIFNNKGGALAYSDAIMLHTGSGSVAVQTIVNAVSQSEIYPGDAFICNDPHTSGSSHAPDVTVISPIFIEGEIIAWAQSQAHVLDIGGMTAGGFAITAKDNISEGLLFPPGVKVYERGKPVEGIKKIILNNVRIPVSVWNDIRSLIAANQTGVKRMIETLNEFGLERFQFYTQKSIELTERVIRERFESIPDGVYEAEDWAEYKGDANGLYRVHCRMTVHGDTITLDFSQSSKQTDSLINCGYGAFLGSIITNLLLTVGWDLPFNAGMVNPITIIAPKGTIVNPNPPSPVSGGHMYTGGKVIRVLTKVFNKAFQNSSDKTMNNRMQGEWTDPGAVMVASAINDKGDYTIFFTTEVSSNGIGAQYNSDGLDCGGSMYMQNNTFADVESNELSSPLLYLWRKLNPSSGGPGFFRGGLGLDFAYTLWGAESADLNVFTTTSEVPAEGFGGGYPGGGTEQNILRSTNLEELLSIGQVPDSQNLTSENPGKLEMIDNSQIRKNEVFWQTTQGGGGFGDPLLRPIDKIQYDLNNGLVTKKIAQIAHGVIFVEDTLELDKQKTHENRRSLRAMRINKSFDDVQDIMLNAEYQEHSIMIQKNIDGTYSCKQCSSHLGSEQLEYTKKVVSSLSEKIQSLGMQVRERNVEPPVLLVEQYCPDCGTSVRTSVSVRN